jgi:hypothetical protein
MVQASSSFVLKPSVFRQFNSSEVLYEYVTYAKFA